MLGTGRFRGIPEDQEDCPRENQRLCLRTVVVQMKRTIRILNGVLLAVIALYPLRTFIAIKNGSNCVFPIVGLTEDDFGSLRGEMLEKYMEKFQHPEKFMRFGDQIMTLKIPDYKQKEDQTKNHHMRR